MFLLKEKSRKACTIKTFARDVMTTDGRKLEWRISHIVLGFSLAALISYMLLHFHYLSSEAVSMLIVFNFLFVSLTFPLNGTLTTKVVMLSLGNMIGLLWNYVFSLFISALISYFGELFNTLYLILSPFLNLVWIVTFYSLSLTFLVNLEIKQARAGT